MRDIYFEDNYGRLYEGIENGKCETFAYDSALGGVKHIFIKREIPCKIGGEQFFDLVTPYGYGGPIFTSFEEGKKEKLLDEFSTAFQEYCLENNIVSEFIRFHPVINNAIDFQSMYKIEKVRKTVGTNTRDYTDPITSEFSKSTRKTIRRILSLGVSYKVTEKPNNIDSFKEIYYKTMDRNKASSYYYFDDSYFNKCMEFFKDSIILIEVFYSGKVIASGFYFVYNKMIHAHLSGTLTDYLKLSPAYIIKYATVKWALENGVDLIHYGGGTTDSDSDLLYQFKRKFGKNTEFDFYIGKKIWNLQIYNKMNQIVNADKSSNFFPLYRA